MFGRILGHISKRTLQISGIVVLTILVVFFAATRSQVGRDELKRQIENSFNTAFQGHLSIDRLTGNLLYTLYAEHVQLTAPNGELIATIDSVVIEPRWQDLLQRTFSVKSISLHHPVFEISGDENGQLNLNQALQPRARDSVSIGSDWTFKSATLHIENGHLLTRNLGDPNDISGPNRVFDFANASFDDLNLDARIDWDAPHGQIDLLGFSGFLDNGRLRISGQPTQLIIQGPRLSVNNFIFTLGSSTFNLNGFANILQSVDNQDWWDVPFLANLDQSHISFDELKTLFPSIPLSGEATVSALIQGPLADATVSWIRLGTDKSDFELTGMIRGFPDSVSFDVAFSAVNLDPADLKSWLPGSPIESLTMNVLSLKGVSLGSYILDPEQPFLAASGYVDISSDKGSVSTTYEIEGPFDDEMAFDIGLTSNNMDLSYWTSNRAVQTNFNGAFRLIGSGIDPETALAEFRLDLTNAKIGTAFLPAISLTGKIEDGRYQANLVASQPTGSVEIDANGRFGNELFDYALFFKARSFDAGPLVGNDSLATTLNFEAILTGSGLSENDLAGELQITFDTSGVRLGSRTSVISPHSHTLAIRRPGSVGPRITLRGDMADIDVTGEVNLAALSALSAAWLFEFRSALERQGDKRLYGQNESEAPSDDILDSLLWADARIAFEGPLSGKTTNIKSDIIVHDLSIVSAYVPSLPRLESSGTARITVSVGDQDISITASYLADSLRIGGISLGETQLESQITASRNPSIEESLKASLSLVSDSLIVFGQPFQAPTLEFSLQNREGSLTFFTPGARRIDSVVVASRIFLLEDRNEIIFDEINVVGRTTTWQSSGSPTISLYSDAVVVRDAEILQHGPDGLTGQRIMASGTFSSQVQDTLHVQADNVILHEISEILVTSPHLDGRLNAVLEITRADNQPIVAGAVDISQFSLDNRILGDVEIQSRLLAGSPDLGVHLAISPINPTTDIEFFEGESFPSLVANQLEIDGTIRLPNTSRSGISDPGSLSLDVQIESADIFFLEYVFNDLENVVGYFKGGGRIDGTMSNPRFDINLELYDGHFEIPQFELAYDLSGDLGIGVDGIRIDAVQLVDQTGGTALASGMVFFNDYRFFSLGLKFDLDNFQVMDVGASEELPFYGHLWATGTLSLDGPLYDATLRSTDAVVSPNSELFIPVVETALNTDEAYIVFVDSAGHIPNFQQLAKRSFLLGHRPDAERRFLDALDMDLSIFAPNGATIHLVIDPLLGDVINASSTGRIQIQRNEGDFLVFGELLVNGGDYLFTAGEVFVRRFVIEQGGSISWNGDPVNAALDIPAVYRTRASLAGLPGYEDNALGLIPLIVSLQIGGTVESPTVELGLSIDRSRQNVPARIQALEAQLNSPERATEYATSVLLTNTFRLTTDSFGSGTGSQLVFNSVSQLVSSQVNRFINQALPNVDFSFGLQGENAQDLDVTYGVALRLLDERLIIRGEGVYQGSRTNTDNVSTPNDGLQGEFLVEVKLSPRVSVEVFFRREGGILQSATLTNTTGAGLSYQTEFSTWKSFWRKLFGWMTPNATDSNDSVTIDPTTG
ncbi:MAG: translocation/assembly module TamB domain-containing protein [Bacteroidetes bacterium]|nr:translocation/assembly module TamB domain-containing protein [Bacteroidota bacterium]